MSQGYTLTVAPGEGMEENLLILGVNGFTGRNFLKYVRETIRIGPQRKHFILYRYRIYHKNPRRLGKT